MILDHVYGLRVLNGRSKRWKSPGALSHISSSNIAHSLQLPEINGALSISGELLRDALETISSSAEKELDLYLFLRPGLAVLASHLQLVAGFRTSEV